MEQAVKKQEPMLAGIQSADVAKWWPLVEPMLRKALVRTNAIEDFDPEHIKAFCESQNMQLWVAFQGGQLLAAFITEVLKFPKRKVLSMFLIGADSHTISLWHHFVDTFKAFARENGCKVIRGYGRKGWLRTYPIQGDYSVIFTVGVDE